MSTEETGKSANPRQISDASREQPEPPFRENGIIQKAAFDQRVLGLQA